MSWIIDGNNTRSLEMRFSRADLVVYFNLPKARCFFRIIKRFLSPNTSFDDRAPGCAETIRLSLLKYMWTFEKRVAADIKALKEGYPHVVFKEIKSTDDLNALENELMDKLRMTNSL